MSAVGGVPAAEVRAAEQGAGVGRLAGPGGARAWHRRHDVGHDSRTHAEARAVREAGEKTVALGEKETRWQQPRRTSSKLTSKGTSQRKTRRRAKEQELLARRRFYAAQTNLAQQAWEAGQPARTLDLLESLRPKLDQEDLRGFDWYYLWRLCHRNLHRTLSGPKGEAVYALAITPDGTTLVSGSADAQRPSVGRGHGERAGRAQRSHILDMAFGDFAGRQDGCLGEHGWHRETMGSRHERVAGDAHESAPRCARWRFRRMGRFSPSGRKTVSLELWDVGARKQRLTLQADSAPTVALAYSPDGKMLAAGAGWNTSRGPGGVKVWDVTSEPPRIVFQGGFSHCAAFSPDSKLLATCHGTGVKVWSVPSGELKATLVPGNSCRVGCFFSGRQHPGPWLSATGPSSCGNLPPAQRAPSVYTWARSKLSLSSPRATCLPPEATTAQ